MTLALKCYWACIYLRDSKTELKNRVKSNCDAIANFSLIFLNSEFLIKIKFPSHVTRKFYLYLITLEFLS